MATTLIQAKLDEELLSRLDSFAEANTNGNRSKAIKYLLEQSLGNEETDRIEILVNQAVERGMEGIARASSRGAKASLATLVLLSQSLPGIIDTQLASGRVICEMSEDEALAEDQFESAALEIRDLEAMSASSIFDWAWNCGGRIQQSKAKPSMRAAKGGDLHAGGFDFGGR